MLSIWKQITQTSMIRILGIASSVVLMILTARWLGPEGRGVISALISWAGILGVFFSFSLGNVGLHKISVLREETPHGHLVQVLFISWLLLCLAGIGSVLVMLYWFGGQLFGHDFSAYALLLLAFVPLTILEQMISPVVIALGKLRLVNIRFLYSKVIALALIVVIVGIFHLGLWAALWIFFISQMVLSTAGVKFLFALYRQDKRRTPRLAPMMIRGAFQYHLTSIGVLINEFIDIILINYFLGSAATGEYHLALQVAALLLIFPQAMALVMNARVAKEGAASAWHLQRSLIVWMLAGEVAVSLILSFAAPVLIPLLVGPEFHDSIELLPWLLAGMIGKSMSMLLVSQWIGRGHFALSSLLTLLMGLINMGANIVLIPHFGLLGAAWASVAMGVVSFLGNGAFAYYCEQKHRESHEPSPIG